MTIEDPLWLHGAVQFDAREFRRVVDAVFSEGVLGATSFAVTQRGLGPTMSVDIGAGLGVIQGDDQSTQGKYLVRSTATENVAVSAAPLTNQRYDLVVKRVNDPTAGGASGNNSTFEVIAGISSASPTVPPVPPTALALATLGPITSSTTSITNSLITDLRVLAALAHDVVDDDLASRLGTAAAAAGTIARRDGSGRMKVAGAAVGDDVANLQDVSTAVNNIVVPVGGSINSGSIQYRKVGGMVYVWTTPHWNSTVAATLPVGYRPQALVGAATAGVDDALVTIATNGVLTDTAGIGNRSFAAHYEAA